MARHRLSSAALAAGLSLAAASVAVPPAAAAESVLVQCGQQYQAAKAAGTLNGSDWNQYRTDCTARLKAQPAATAPAAPAVVPASAPASTASPAPAATGGRDAMHQRQKQCGAEWTANKVTLVAQTPGLTWPRYWSQCNTRLKAAGR